MCGALSLENWSITELAADLLKNNDSMASFSPVNLQQLWLITHRDEQPDGGCSYIVSLFAATVVTA